MGRIRRRRRRRRRKRCPLSGDQPARSRGHPTCWQAPPWASALPLAQGRIVRPGRPPAGPERPGGPSWWHAPGCPPPAPAGTLCTAPSDAAAQPGCSLRWGSGEAGLSARSRALGGSDARGVGSEGTLPWMSCRWARMISSQRLRRCSRRHRASRRWRSAPSRSRACDCISAFFSSSSCKND